MKYLLSLALTLVLALGAFAQAPDTIQVDVTKLSADQLRVYQQLKSMQNQNQLAASIENLTPEKIDKYAQIGKAFGTAFKECWTTVSTDAERFAQSDAGKLTMVLVAWKIVGQDGINLVEKAVQYAVGIPMLFIGTLLFAWIIRRNCFEYPALVSSTKVGWLTVKREYKGTEKPIWGGEEAFVAVICYGIFIGICCLILFVG